MNRVIAEYLSEVLKAYSEDKIIGYRKKNPVNCAWEVYKGQSIDENYYEYRIKPEPKYRPYKNAEEFLKAQKEHGPYLQRMNNAVFRMPIMIDDKIIEFNTGDYDSYEDLLELGKWQDGTPIGILEE